MDQRKKTTPVKIAKNHRLTASIVIPTYNRPNLALKAAYIIRKFHPDIQITIVDQQNSSKLDPKKVKKLNIQYFNLPEINTSASKNKGIMESKGDIIFFFDDDVEITKNTIPSQLSQYDNGEVVATSGRVINDNEKVPKNTNVETGKTNSMGTKFLQQFWSTKEQAIDFPYGCNMSFKKSVLTKINSFDTRFPKIFEEIDLGKRAKKYGKLIFVPQALVYHHKAPSGGTRTSAVGKMKMIYVSYGCYLAKHVLFPLSLISLVMRTRTALKEAPYAILDLYKGYFNYFINMVHE